MFVLTEDAVLLCDHKLGVVQIVRSQDWLTIEGRAVLVANDPEGKPIKGCPNTGIGIVPCSATLKVQKGYSSLVRAGGHRLCLDPVTGLTIGHPPGTVHYTVASPGQDLVVES